MENDTSLDSPPRLEISTPLTLTIFCSLMTSLSEEDLPLLPPAECPPSHPAILPHLVYGVHHTVVTLLHHPPRHVQLNPEDKPSISLLLTPLSLT